MLDPLATSRPPPEPSKRPRHNEKEVEAFLRTQLKKRGWLCIKMEGTYRGETGWPDRIAVSPQGEHIWIEVKSEAGKLRPNQLRRIEELRRHGVLVLILHGLDEVRWFLKLVDMRC